jgi:ubiquinone/menaquinone biosynthesis C-methylase UbiE
MQRVAIAEWLDTDSGTADEISASLADLRWINRWFGGVGTTEWMLRRVAQQLGKSSLSVLEAASGSGYVPQICKERLARNGVNIEITLLDRARSHLRNGHRAVVGDALKLPFRDGSFDVVSCSLFAHHLGPPDLVRFVNEGLRVCRGAVLINDLMRCWPHLALVYAGLPLYRSRLTRHDAPASVRQAYTVDEMRALLRQVSAAKVEIHRRYFFRMAVIVWKRRP